MIHRQLALRGGKKWYRSNEALLAEGLAFLAHGFQIVHRAYCAASFGDWSPQREVTEPLMITIGVDDGCIPN
jgi:hypothetical protein